MIIQSDGIVLESRLRPGDELQDNQDVSRINDEDIFFAKERYNLHQSSPEEGVDTDILQKYFFRKYGF